MLRYIKHHNEYTLSTDKGGIKEFHSRPDYSIIALNNNHCCLVICVWWIVDISNSTIITVIESLLLGKCKENDFKIKLVASPFLSN